MAAGCLPLWPYSSKMTVLTGQPEHFNMHLGVYVTSNTDCSMLLSSRMQSGWAPSLPERDKTRMEEVNGNRGVRQGERETGCRGRASVRSKRRGLNKASGPHKAELSDILINNCSSIKGQAIGWRQRNCSAVAVSPRRSDSTFFEQAGVEEGNRDRWMWGMTRNKGRLENKTEWWGRDNYRDGGM